MDDENLSEELDRLFYCHHVSSIEEILFDVFSNKDSLYELIDLECLKPRIIQFFSIDILGSTAMKQSGNSDVWFESVLNFFGIINSVFAKAWETAKENLLKIKNIDDSLIIGPKPEFWKGSGDEALFRKELKHPAEALYLLSALIDGISNFNIPKSRSENDMLQFKLSSWIATFPVPNRQIIINHRNTDLPIFGNLLDLNNLILVEEYYRSSGSNHLIMDYVGPSMDTGFRIAGHATHSRVSLSIELAHLLAATCNYIKQEFEPKMDMEIFLLGSLLMKGVFNGKPLPVFWTPAQMSDTASRVNESLSLMDFHKLESFAHEFIDRHRGLLYPVYIPCDTWELFHKIDPYLKEHYEKLIKKIRAVVVNRQTETESFQSVPSSWDQSPAPSGDQAKTAVNFLKSFAQRPKS